MPTYQVISLVDITRSKPNRDETDVSVLSQQANFNSLIQAIGLRSNIEWEIDPIKHHGALPYPFEGKGTYWEWSFRVEREDVFLDNDDSVALLKQDLHNIPIIVNLDETIEIDPPVFQTIGSNFNLFVNEKV